MLIFQGVHHLSFQLPSHSERPPLGAVDEDSSHEAGYDALMTSLVRDLGFGKMKWMAWRLKVKVVEAD